MSQNCPTCGGPLPDTALGQRLRELRLKQNLTQSELAQKMGVSNQQISQSEARISGNIKLSTLRRYGAVFGMTVSQIMEGVDA